jgi:DNA-binding phage protein
MTMKHVKIPTSESYQSSLSRLSDPTYAAVYLETHFEEPTPEPELLQLALSNVSQALLMQSPDRAADHQRQLTEWLAQPGSIAIHEFANWLSQLGLKLMVTVDRASSLPINDADSNQLSNMVTNTIDQLQQTDRPQAAEPAALLTQLQRAIEQDPTLSESDKIEAIEQVGTLDQAGQNPEDGRLKKLANTALKVIKGTVAALPATATLVEAVNQLLPTIARLLGL